MGAHASTAAKAPFTDYSRIEAGYTAAFRIMGGTPNADRRWPLTSVAARLLWLHACCAIAESAECSPAAATTHSCAAAAALHDPYRRVCVLGGREGMPRSLGSVYGGAVARFLGGSVSGTVTATVDIRHQSSPDMHRNRGFGVSANGNLLVGSLWCGDIYELSPAPQGSLLRVVGDYGVGKLEFDTNTTLHVARDGFVFVAEFLNNRVLILTPALTFYGFIGRGQLDRPSDVCASATLVVVTELEKFRVAMFRRSDGVLLRRICGAWFRFPQRVCFLHGDSHVAIADAYSVRVFSTEGEFVRVFGAGVWGTKAFPSGVASSACDELVVSERSTKSLYIFSATGDLLMKFGTPRFMNVVVWCGSVFARGDRSIVVYGDAGRGVT